MMSRKAVRYWVPAVAAGAIVAVVAVAVPLSANAAVALPSKTPAEVISLVVKAKVSALSGTISQVSDLGIPALPTTGTSSSTDASASSALELLSGSHTARIYLDGASKVRVQVMDDLAERDAVRNGSDIWLYDSKAGTAVHSTVSATDKTRPQTDVTTPSDLATKLLTTLDPTTAVTLGSDLRIAGRSAYDLVLTPKSSATLVSSVSIAVDSATGLPLQVQVFAKGQKSAAFGVGFTALTIGSPSASLFSFTPPAGTKVTEKAAPKHDATAAPQARPTTGMKPTVTGTGWDAVVSLAADPKLTKSLSSPLFTELTTPVAGGRLAHTSLVNILITSDGRVFAGSVPAARLEAIAAGQ